MSSEWEVGRLDLDAYLHRIGYEGSLEPTGATLASLHRGHVQAIAFEKLDVILGRGVSIDLDDVADKLVRRGRGGYCYEHGVLFAAVLERMGFRVDRLLARIGADEQRPRPRTHMTLHVNAGEQSWLADVGFGAGLLQPLPWGDTGTHGDGGWTYQLTRDGGGGQPSVPLEHSERWERWELWERQPGGWAVLYSFTEEPQHLSDVVMSNHFTSTHPSSPFVTQIIAMRKDPGQRRRLLGRTPQRRPT